MILRSSAVICRFHKATAFFVLASGVFCLALVLGGGTLPGQASDAVVELVSLPLLGWAIMRAAAAPHCRHASLTLAILAAILLLPLLQVVPLPPDVWMLLPGREKLAATYSLLGQELPWWPLSLVPEATVRAFVSTLPAAALFLAMLTIDLPQRRLLSLGFVAVAAGSVLLGLLQVVQGGQSPLRFYEITNPTSSVGFFANRNHYAALLCAAVPFALAWAISLAETGGQGWRVRSLIAGLVAVLLILGITLSFSRAGFLLSVFAFAASILLIDLKKTRTSRTAGKWLLALVGLIALVLVANYALAGVFHAFASKLGATIRPQIWHVTEAGAGAMFPAGSGLGTFQTVYGWFDRPETLIAGAFVNHAHNDWLELVLEAGLPAVMLVLAFLWWFLRHARWALRAPSTEDTSLDLKLVRAAAISVLILLLHSLVDYPLRTLAVQAAFAFSCALLVRPLNEPPQTGNGRKPRKATSAGRPSGRTPRSKSSPSESGGPPRPPQFRPSTTWTD
ncbi:O-antigen ligase family protein [Amorphus sp. MBR-141]